MADKQVDPLANLKELLLSITKVILKAFPQLVVILALIFFLILAVLMFLLNGTTIEP